MFFNLNVKSFYTILKSTLSIDKIIQYAAENTSPYVSLVDNNFYGAIEFCSKAYKKGLKPILGLEVIYKDTLLILFARNSKGFKNISIINTFINENKDFDINKYCENVIFCSPSLPHFLNKEVIFYNFSQLPLKPIYCLNEADKENLRAIEAVKNLKLLKDISISSEFGTLDVCDFHDEKTFNDFLSLIELDLEFNSKKMHIPILSNNPKKELEKLCKISLIEKFGTFVNKKYIDRLNEEIKIIDQMGFLNYFLLVSDYVRWAKEHDIFVGPGRGSAAGSLVTFLLGITEVDPIKYDLIFERFLNPYRSSMPDIDIDFMDTKRTLVVDYLTNKYGHDNVSKIITFSFNHTKAAIKDSFRILGISPTISNSITATIKDDEEECFEKLEKKFPDYRNAFNIAKSLKGLPRSVGIHASGYIVSDEPIYNYFSLEKSNDGVLVTQCSHEYCEGIGLIKVDLLALANLSLVYDVIKSIKNYDNKEILFDLIDLNNKKIFKYLSMGITFGIFQLETIGLTGVTKQLKPQSLEDISVAIAIYRPGARDSISEYLVNKNNASAIKYQSKEIEAIMRSTYNTLVYQEQIMKIVQVVTSCNMAEADVFRNIISKKKIELLKEKKEWFFERALKNGYSKEVAEDIFNKLGGYTFNKSHSMSYAILAYRMAFLKFQYPLSFYSCLINQRSDDTSLSVVQKELKTLNIPFLPPDIILSDSLTKPINGGVLLGLSIVKGLNSEVINNILEIRSKGLIDVFDLVSKCSLKGVELKYIKILIESGACDKLLKGKSCSYWLANLEEIYNKAKYLQVDGTYMIEPNLVAADDSKEEEILKNRVNIIGISFLDNPIVEIKNKYQGEYKDKLVSLSSVIGKDILQHCLVYLKKIIKKPKTVSLAIEDDSHSAFALMFQNIYIKYQASLVEGKYYIMGLKDSKFGLQAMSIREIDK